MASVVIFGDITGGHFNPAVTLGVFTSLGEYGKNWLFCLLIILAQFVGGFAAIGLNYVGNWNYPSDLTAILAPKNPATGSFDNASGETNWSMDYAVIQNEIICTFLFVSVILMVKGEHTAGDRKGVCAAICVVLTLLAVISGTNSLGACFNPAVGVTLTTNAVIRLNSTLPNNHFLTHYLYAYTVGPAIGGVLAGIFHLFHKKAHVPDEHLPGFASDQKQGLIDHDYA